MDIIHEQLKNYWHTICGAQIVPSRTDFRPAKLEPIREYIFIAKIDEADQIRFELTGHKINMLFGKDMRGCPLSRLLAPRVQAQFAKMLVNVCQRPALLECTLQAHLSTEQMCSAQFCALPLRANDTRIEYILGSLEGFEPLKHPIACFDHIAAAGEQALLPMPYPATPSYTGLHFAEPKSKKWESKKTNKKNLRLIKK